MNLECSSTDANDKYWKLALDNDMTLGLDFYVLTDKYSDVTFGFSIATLYTSVILVIGRAIRGALAGEFEKLFVKCTPNPD